MDGEVEQFEDDAETQSATGPRLRLFLIGEFRAEDRRGKSLLPISKKARALLCLMAMARPQGVLRAVAGTYLWQSRNREAVANSLRSALGELRPLLENCGRPYVLATKRGRMTLDPDSVWIDVLDMAAIDAARIDPADPANALCQDLRRLSPMFDSYLDRLWVEIGYRRELQPPAAVALPPQVDRRAAVAAAGPNGANPPRPPPPDPNSLNGHPTVAGISYEKLDRFPPTLTATAEIPLHQLGWRMAVLPFRSLGAPIGHGIALGMAEEVSAALGRFRSPRVIATASFLEGSGPAPDAMSRCRSQNLDYIIDGIIQVAGDKVRVTVTLLDVVLAFEVIWSHRFDGSMADLFSLQDRIAAETVAQIDPELHQRRWAAVASAKTDVAQAHHLVLAAIKSIYRLDRPQFLRAREMLSQAIDLDPDYSAAHAWLAYWGILAVSHGWIDNPRQVTEMAGASAERAVLLDPMDARALAIAGHVKAYLKHDVTGAARLHARAIELNPNLPIAWTFSAWSKIYSGDHATAVRHAMTAQGLSPLDPHLVFVQHALMTAHFFKRDLEDAETLSEVVFDRNKKHVSALNVRLAVLGHMGRTAEAAEALSLLREIEPEVTVSSIAARPPLQHADREYYMEGLRRAGVPD
jgi:TolB-like protein